MISYTLKCEHDHTFDSWFQSAEAFDKLLAAGMVTCSVCGALGVEKAVMAPRVRPARNAASPSERPLSAPASPAEQALAEMRKAIEANSEDVGDNFAKEARKIHDGDAPERSIIGQAKLEDAKALIEDGIPVAPLPWGQKKRAN
ncbi:DUF1178 family protein [Amylibacter sp. IMCC11727]|uniref:DUF1178 family protein n=1 Tax=Amylibacter sp. IMCC11727 TaxID=3039851 RepID=UPI00244E51BF|nr:DUF1178 family protein [Amylibacter sp. IMCC11727]WGI21103.1 DUF1178 family protein [Amylibacter sp. IMCC11727]